MLPGVLLWLLGVPLVVIVLLYLVNASAFGDDTAVASKKGHRLIAASTAKPAIKTMNKAAIRPAREASRCMASRACS